MQVIIPAAGMGKRLGEETANKTKCMVKLGNKTLIEHCLDSVTKHQISRIIIVVGFEKNKLKKFLGKEYMEPKSFMSIMMILTKLITSIQYF